MNRLPPVLAIDVGNTSTKLGEFDWPSSEPLASPRRVVRISSADPAWDLLEAWMHPTPQAAFLISVCRPAADRVLEWLAQRRPSCGVRSLQLADFPLRVDVEYPERVGQDRLAAAVAARALKSPDRAAIVIDAGSAITVDLVSPPGDFLGGAILPGWQTMARSLALGTHLLPHVDNAGLAEPPPVVGRSTEQAITSGLYWGTVGAVREIVERMTRGWQPQPDQLLAGGDMQSLLPHLGSRMRCVDDLVLRGIINVAATLPTSWP